MAAEPRAALRRALKSYLEAQLGSTYSAMKFFDEWPHGQLLGDLALSIVVPPQDVDVIEHPPVQVKFTPIGGGDTGTLQYTRGRATVGLQIDLWTAFPAARDEVIPVVNAKLNRPPAATLGGDTTSLPAQSPGLVLALPEFYGTHASLTFNPFPRLYEDSETQQTGKWRATWTGEALVHLLSEEAVATMKHLTLKLGINGGPSEDVALFQE